MLDTNNGGPNQIKYSIWNTKTDAKYKERVQKYVRNRRAKNNAHIHQD